MVGRSCSNYIVRRGHETPESCSGVPCCSPLHHRFPRASVQHDRVGTHHLTIRSRGYVESGSDPFGVTRDVRPRHMAV